MQIGYLIGRILRFYEILVVVWALMSWIPRERGGLLDDISQVLSSLIEPALAPIRSVLPPMAGVDFSPMVLIVLIDLVRSMLLRL